MREKEKVARPGRFERPTLCSGGTRSIQLSYGRAEVETTNYSLAFLTCLRQRTLLRPAVSDNWPSVGQRRCFRCGVEAVSDACSDGGLFSQCEFRDPATPVRPALVGPGKIRGERTKRPPGSQLESAATGIDRPKTRRRSRWIAVRTGCTPRCR